MERWRREFFSFLTEDRARWHSSKSSELQTWMGQIVQHPVIQSTVQSLLEFPIQVQGVDVFAKAPLTGMYDWLIRNRFNVRPHVDTHVSPEMADQKLTVWIPLGGCRCKDRGTEIFGDVSQTSTS